MERITAEGSLTETTKQSIPYKIQCLEDKLKELEACQKEIIAKLDILEASLNAVNYKLAKLL